MAKNAKKGWNLPKGLETLIGVGGRQGLKGGTKRFMEWLRANHPKTYYDTAFIMTEPEAAGVKALFKGGLIGTGVLVENVGDALKVPELVMEGVEIIFGDLPGTFDDYFDANKPTYPAGYTKPKLEGDAIKAFANQLNELLKGWGRSLVGKWYAPLGTALGNLFTDPRQRMFKNLARLPEEQVRAFFTNIDDLSGPDRNYLAQCVNLIDELDELVFWAERSPAQLKQAIGWAKRVEDQHLLRRSLREAYVFGKKHWPEIERRMLIVLHEIEHGLRQAETSLQNTNATRRQQIAAERLSDDSLARYPWRRKELPMNDPRRPAAPKAAPKVALTAWVVAGFVLVSALIIGLNAGLGHHRTYVPTVTITSPTNMSQLTTVPVLIGMASDDDQVVSMDYQVNGGNRLPLKIQSGRTVNWTVSLDSTSTGMLHVVVSAVGSRGKIGTSELYLSRIPPPPTAVPDSAWPRPASSSTH